jgi:hypothetical protein
MRYKSAMLTPPQPTELFNTWEEIMDEASPRSRFLAELFVLF